MLLMKFAEQIPLQMLQQDNDIHNRVLLVVAAVNSVVASQVDDGSMAYILSARTRKS